MKVGRKYSSLHEEQAYCSESWNGQLIQAQMHLKKTFIGKPPDVPRMLQYQKQDGTPDQDCSCRTHSLGLAAALKALSSQMESEVIPSINTHSWQFSTPREPLFCIDANPSNNSEVNVLFDRHGVRTMLCDLPGVVPLIYARGGGSSMPMWPCLVSRPFFCHHPLDLTTFPLVEHGYFL